MPLVANKEPATEVEIVASPKRDQGKSAPENRRFSVYLPETYLEVLEQVARRQETSRASVIRALVADVVRREQVA